MVSIHGPLGYEPNTLDTAPLRSVTCVAKVLLCKLLSCAGAFAFPAALRGRRRRQGLEDLKAPGSNTGRGMDARPRLRAQFRSAYLFARTRCARAEAGSVAPRARQRMSCPAANGVRVAEESPPSEGGAATPQLDQTRQSNATQLGQRAATRFARATVRSMASDGARQ